MAFWLYDQTHLAGAQGHFSCQSCRPGECCRRCRTDPRTHQVQLVSFHPLLPATVLLLPFLHTHESVTFPGDQRLQGQIVRWITQIALGNWASLHLQPRFLQSLPGSCMPMGQSPVSVTPGTFRSPFHTHALHSSRAGFSLGCLHSLLRNSTQPFYYLVKIAFRASEGKMINSTINNVKFLEGKIPQSQQTNNQQGKGAVAYQ